MILFFAYLCIDFALVNTHELYCLANGAVSLLHCGKISFKAYFVI